MTEFKYIPETVSHKQEDELINDRYNTLSNMASITIKTEILHNSLPEVSQLLLADR